jgi:uroporphyrinogen decarboxylase
VVAGPLAHAESSSDLDAYPWPDPSLLRPGDYAAARRRFPEKALVFCPGWMPLFWTACEAFGMEAALVNMITRPALFDAFIQRQHAVCMDILTRGAKAASGQCDIAWLGDDFAHQGGMIISPALWRRHIKPYLAEQVRVMRENGLLVLFHSCGAVRPVLEDLIEIGVNALLVFQTTAKGMDPASIAQDFGGRLAFYGGIDIQRLLSYGTPGEVEAGVIANIAAFSACGGYIVANSHHTVATIRGENIEAMCETARRVKCTSI